MGAAAYPGLLWLTCLEGNPGVSPCSLPGNPEQHVFQFDVSMMCERKLVGRHLEFRSKRGSLAGQLQVWVPESQPCTNHLCLPGQHKNLLCSNVFINDIQKSLNTKKYLKTFKTVSCYGPTTPQMKSLQTHLRGHSGRYGLGCGTALQIKLTGMVGAFPDSPESTPPLSLLPSN